MSACHVLQDSWAVYNQAKFSHNSLSWAMGKDSRVKWQGRVLFINLMRVTPSHGLRSKHAQCPADGAYDSEWAHRCFPTHISKLSLIIFPIYDPSTGTLKNSQFGQGLFKEKERLSSNKNIAIDCIIFLELYHRVGKGHLLPKWNEKERKTVAKYGLEFTKSMKNFNQLQCPPAQPSSANLLAHRQLSKPQRQCIQICTALIISLIA